MEACRKVQLWTRRPWSGVDPVSFDTVPGGRFVAGGTETDLGPLSVFGVCLPWSDVHIRTDRKDGVVWQDQEDWLSGFTALPWRQARERAVVPGEFDQRIRQRGLPKRGARFNPSDHIGGI